MLLCVPFALSACSPGVGAPPTPTRSAPVVATGAAAASAKPSSSPSSATHGGSLQLGSTAYNNHGTQDITGKDELELEADDFYFAPTFLQGRPGQKVKVEIDNQGRATHNVSITAQSVDTDVPAGQKAEVEITFPQSGVVRYFCKFHAAQGMNGELLVGDATPQPAT